MHRHHNRTLTIKKQDLINKIKENKELHIEEYNKAIEAYKVEAQKQLNEAQTELNNGSLKINLSLVTPVNRAEEYDKVVAMFEWEIDENVSLTQDEFNEYIHDDNDSARHAKFLNATYLMH